ncbi:MAG: helix-turn-helix domain-containing protein [Oscillospiraceae bacterium]|jgi:Mn-dependent DtxR family transcriptional regulator|nr:helix-turn-helix domain-containing protein [Oscillospiraceae bacterium]
MANTLKSLSDADLAVVHKICEIIQSKLCECPTIAELARETGTSTSKLQSDFKSAIGMTIHEFACEERMRRALELIEATDEPIARVAGAVGCKKPGRFAEQFRERYGLTPSEYRKRGKLSVRLESYLDAVHELSATGGGARLTDLAARMGVTKSSAGAAVAALTKQNLAEGGHYQLIRLTAAGENIAKDLTRKHETIRRFFCEVLGLDAETADSEACAIEHIVCGKTIAAMREQCGSTNRTR